MYFKLFYYLCIDLFLILVNNYDHIYSKIMGQVGGGQSFWQGAALIKMIVLLELSEQTGILPF